LRSALVEAQEEDYVRTARGKGITERRVMLRHALRTSLIAFVSLFGLDFGALVGGGALLTEVVFGPTGCTRSRPRRSSSRAATTRRPRASSADHTRIPGARWEIFEQSSHMPHVEEPEAFLARVEAFLETVD
jgi:hypothetical protein